MVYRLFNEFINTFLIEKRDFLSGSNEIVLTQEALAEIIRVFVENQIGGTGMNFAEKLKTQFQGASENSKIVFAHASWLFVLGSNSMTTAGKINAVKMSLFDIPEYSLRESIFLNKEGISDPGTAYNTSKPLSLRFLINMFNWLLMSGSNNTQQDVVDRIEAICLYGNYRQDSYLMDYFDTKTSDDIIAKFALEAKKDGSPAKIIILNYLLNLCQPDKYERMASFRDKKAIAKKLFLQEYGSKEGLNIDDQIRVIKENLAKQNPDIDPTHLLYHPRIKPLWNRVSQADSPKQDTMMEGELIEHTPRTNSEPRTKRSLNSILFGPPGTGKTYNSINHAVEITDPVFWSTITDKDNQRGEITKRYRELVKDGRIVFTTFHQSLSYEDFIEGIKPVTHEEKNNIITYEVLPGIFKKLCDKAKLNDGSSFEKSYKKLLSDLGVNPTNVMKLKTPNDTEFGVSLNSNDNLNLHPGCKPIPNGSLTKDILISHINGNEIPLYFRGYYQGVVLTLKEKYGFNENQSANDNYVMIIDEINRGNVSQIFGELITLIEPDKRMGCNEALEVTLPYKKDKFSVPANLYIIGTMNTADRSVEALDTALRRRFSFIEMAPEYELLDGRTVDGIDLGILLRAINDRIEVLLNKDHAIGHSYFLRVLKGECSLKEVFFNEIIPLLQEYFYGNFGRIELVLGTGFVKPVPVTTSIFAYPSSENEVINEHVRFSLVRPERMTDEAFLKALKTLLKEIDEPTQD